MVSPKLRTEAPLILASLFIAGVIWLIAKQADYEPDRLQAPLKLENKPESLIVEAFNKNGEPQPKVGILVQYPKRLSNMIIERNFSVPINLEAIFGKTPEDDWDFHTPFKEVEYQLRPSNVKCDLDPTIQVVSVDPESIVLRARLLTQAAKVVTPTTGQLPPNLMLVGIQPEPAQVLFTGSPEALAKLTNANGTVKTEPIDLSAVRPPGTQYTRMLVKPDAELKILGPKRVTVNVAVAEKPVPQTIANVPITLVTFSPNLKAVTEPQAASVVVEGPASALRSLSANDIEFSTVRELEERPGKVYDVGLEARLKTTVPGEVAKQIKIVEIKPSRISVEFTPVDTQNK